MKMKTNTGSAAFEHFDQLAHTSLQQTLLSILDSQWSMAVFPFHSSTNQKKKCYCMLFVLGANFLCSSHLYAMLSQYKQTTGHPHSQHVII
jgi:hypothetical protein